VDVYFAAETASRTRLDRAIAAYKKFTEKYGSLHHQWVVRNSEAMRAILNGNFAQAEILSEEARALGEATKLETVDGVFGVQMFSIRREQGRLAEVAPVIKRLVDEGGSDQDAWRPGFALVASDLGFLDAARQRLAEQAAQGFQSVSDAKRSASLSYWAEVAIAVEDKTSADLIYDLLRDYRDMTITVGLVTVCYGSAARFLGMLAAALDKREVAADHFEHALDMDGALGARPWLAHTRAEYAALLRRRGDRASIERAEILAQKAMTTAVELGMARLQRRLQMLTH
jgi:tetratricopeptide (TPR) repeat protein